MDKSIVITSDALRDDYDAQTLQRLQEYCRKMRIQLRAFQDISTNRLSIEFKGSEAQLMELQTYLEGKL